MKHYITTTRESEFIVDANCVGVAIAKLWSSELTPLLEFSEQQLDFVRWSLFAVEPAYWIHSGRFAEGSTVHASCAIPHLSQWAIEMAVRCFLDSYDETFVRDFSRGIV